jgi:hypothetical protein
MTLAEFLTREGITATAEWADDNPDAICPQVAQAFIESYLAVIDGL